MVEGFDEVFLLRAVEIADHVAGDGFGYVVMEMGVINDGVRGSR